MLLKATRLSRRLASLALAIAAIFFPADHSVAAEPLKIVRREPVIPQREFTITDFHALGDGKTLNTAAIRATIEACAKAGGGRIIIPEGTFLTGPFELASGMELHLAQRATLKMSDRREDFPPSGRERPALIGATDAQDVQITGEGTIDGQGASWWAEFRQGKAVAPDKTAPRRPQMIAFTRCERVKFAGFRTINPPNTHCSLRQCKEVTIDGLKMIAPDESPNTDALNLNIRNAVIRNCHIATGDDNIVFLASAPARDGSPAVENIVISNCTLGVGHGLSIGSYTSGGIRNIAVENVTFDGTTSAIRMKAGRDRGGLVENITFKNVTMKNVKNPIYFTSYYPATPKRPDDDPGETAGAKTPQWRNITIENGTIKDCVNSITLWGLPEQPIQDVTLRNLDISAERGAVVYYANGIHAENVMIHPEKSPLLTTFKAQVDGLAATPLAPPKAAR